ncbi:ribosome silencing factor [Paucidesulfovibrio longus]|uniref:ribosome silencing factor n=1 Tax=Paucidesulfovibrio longus TaxID=889 RepID=UPI0003B55B1B|nr:ribosome silencing factor [Paucidesulfovibrio longus]
MNKTEKVPGSPSNLEKARLVVEWLDEKQAVDVTAMNVEGLCPITETIVVASARGVRHAQSLADMLLDRSGEQKLGYLGMEGYQSGAWILVDLNDVVVHIFQDDKRSLYNIEGLWSEAERLFEPKAAPAGSDDEDAE